MQFGSLKRGDHFFPDGTVLPWTYLPGNFGDTFLPRANVADEPGKWYCYEVMLKANTPGMRDGRIGCWLDGELVGDFPNIRFRDMDSLKINRIGLSLHFGSNPLNETWKWYDNVVVAKSYIGPMYDPVTKAVTRKGNPETNTTMTLSGKRISFFLEKSSPVKIGLYSLQGRLIRILDDRTYSAGTHSLVWNRMDQSKKPVVRGTYL